MGRILGNNPVPMAIPTALNTQVDLRIFFFSLLLATLVGVIAGLSPATRVSAVNPIATLRSDAGGQTSRRNWVASAVLIAEITVSLVLMVIGGLTIHSVLLLRQLSPGFDATHILVAALDLKAGSYDSVSGTKIVNRLLAALNAQPGVVAASIGWQMPVSGPASPSTGLDIQGYKSHQNEDLIFHYNLVGPDYFKALNIPLLAGREFNLKDDAEAPKVMVINECLANRFWPGQNAIGHRVSFGGVSREIVGIAKEYKHTSLVEAPEPYMYFRLQKQRTSLCSH
jgi:MacB-like periplasmic core domain